MNYLRLPGHSRTRTVVLRKLLISLLWTGANAASSDAQILNDLPTDPDSVRELREAGRAQLRTGNYDAMVRTYSNLEDSAAAAVGDVLGLFNALHLNQQWPAANAALQRALKRFDADLNRMDRQIRDIRQRKDGDPQVRTGPGKESQIRYIEQQKERLIKRWPGLVLLTGQTELLQLKDPEAAVTTLKQGLRYAPEAAREFAALVADAKRVLANEELKTEKRLWHDLMMPVATLRYQAMAHEALGNITEAADCWCRVRLLEMCHRVGLAWVDKDRLISLLDRIPQDQRTPHHQFVRQNPGTYEDYRARPITRKKLVPDQESTPLKAVWLSGEKFTRLGPGNGSMARLHDGRLMLAFTSGDWQQHGIRLSVSDDGQKWERSWALPHNNIFDTRAPSICVDDDGIVWLLLSSKRLAESERYSSAGYRLWLTNSRDGKNWSTLKPVWTKQSLQYQHTAQLTRDHNGRFWIFCNENFAGGESPAAITELKPAGFAPSPQEPKVVCNVHTTFDPSGICHLVYDDFGRSVHYVRSSDMTKWSDPVQIDVKKDGSSVAFPQLLLQDGRGVLLHETMSGLWRRTVDVSIDEPHFSRKLQRLADHIAGVKGGRLFVSGESVFLPAGASYTPAILTATLNELLDSK